MKTIHFFFTSLIVGFIISISPQTQAQNNIWSLPDKYHNFDIGSTHPLPTTYTGHNASNMQMDANGDILFYVVDQDVRDGDGLLIGNFSSFYQSSNPPHYHICMERSNTSEIVIVPDPINCNKYYIISSAETVHNCDSGPYTNPAYSPSEPFVAVLDFNLPRPNNPNKFGALTSVEYLEFLNSMPPEHTWKGTNYIGGGALFAASKLQIEDKDKFRYLFVSLYSMLPSISTGIVRFKIGSNGIVYDGFIPFEVQNADGLARAEMELINLPNGRFRIACPYGSTNSEHNGKDLTASIFTAELDASGGVYPGSEKTLYFYRNGVFSEGPFIHGLEFSPDGSKLFITHNSSYYHNKPFEYYDFDNPNSNDPNGNGIYSLDISSSTINEEDFQSSQIELAMDGKIYLGADERLASLSNPNNPIAANFSDNEIVLPGYHANYGLSGINSNTYPISKTHTLPDQIDGMIYENFAPTAYDEVVYTAQTSGVWEPGSANNPWDSNGDVYIKEKLIIPSGKNVSIENMNFRFGPDAKVIVEQGAKLTIDRSVFTNSRPCNNEELYWHGIQVYGTTDQHQFPSTHPEHQGMLVLKNGATIEYAHHAFTNWNPNHWDEIGGVIQSRDGFFKNNRRGIEFMAYENHVPNNPSNEISNLSYFRNTEFISDDDFIEGYPQQGHVSMWKVKGIDFTNCHFANYISTDKSNSSAPRDGIYALDASFQVKARCNLGIPVGQPCPPSDLLKSSFTGLQRAVQIAGAGITNTATITQTDFINNVSGIFVDEFNNVNINRNEFNIGNAEYSTTFYYQGIYLDNSTGFIVEENSIQNSLSDARGYGIVVNNSGTDNNRVYKNTLEKLFKGTQAKKVNRSLNVYSNKGLQFLCNDYLQNKTAISVEYPIDNNGIRLYQGEFNPKTSAGNTFQYNVKDITNNASHINYYHFGGITEPSSAKVSGPVEIIMTEHPHLCPTSFKSGVVMIDELSLLVDSLGIRLDTLNSTYTNLNYNYISLIDDGDTEVLQTKIETNWSSDAWTLRGNLMQESPYLSKDALLTAAGENILPHAMLLEVLLANPDATRGEDFINELNDVMNSPMPEYMLDYVRSNWDTETVRTDLEAEMASVQAEISTTINFIKYLEKSKEEYVYADRLNTVKMGEGIMNQIERMDFYIENEEWNKADSVRLAIENDEDMEEDLAFIEDFDNYIAFRSGLGDRNIAQLDSSEILYLQTLADKGTRASGYAENILCFFYDICYEKEEGEGSPVAKMMTLPSSDHPTLEELFYELTVYPNPATDFTSIKWEILDELHNAHYKITDLNGREMGTGVIEDNKGEKSIDTRDFTNGVYIINIYNNGNLKMNAKLVVRKER